MSNAHFAWRPTALAACLVLSTLPHTAQAQGVATDAELASVSVSGARSPLAPNLPNTTASKTREELQAQNLFNPEDALELLPSLTVRKRYFGDRNANVGGRTYGVLQPGRSLVYLDGYLISNFLGRFDAPRWNMVNNEAIERVDVLYGPFSAIYPGNSIGTTVVVTERKPKRLEASASLKFNSQPFSEYGSDDTYNSAIWSGRIASRLESGLWYAASLQHQDSEGHPMGYATALRTQSGQFSSTPSGSAVAVTGVRYDKDPNGVDRAIFGATSIDHSKQDTLNLRVGYDLTAHSEIEGRLSYWHNDSQVRTQSSLRDTNGNTIWSGAIKDGSTGFTVSSTAFAPSARQEDHRQLGLTWKTRYPVGWNTSIVATQYKILRDVDHAASTPQPVAELGGAGTLTKRDGTGWNTLELQASYKPHADDLGGGQHALTFGLHRNQYKLDNTVYTATDWRTDQGTVNQYYRGQTTITALYGQDAWKLHPDWTLTSGLRSEQFKSEDGVTWFSGLAAQNYAPRTLYGLSPKLSLAWRAAPDLRLKGSLGKGVRFPNLDELFNGTKTANSIVVSDPNLRPEVSKAAELSAEKDFEQWLLRASYFRDDSRDTILRQSDSSSGTTVTRVSNVDRVLTDGIELTWQAQEVWLPGLDISGSATWTHSKIMENKANPSVEGNNWVRMPRQRYSLQAIYRVNPEWMVAAAYRWHGRMYNTDTNTDINPNVYGGTSSVRKLDVRASWKFARLWDWGFGIDNLTNARSWQAHSLPLRSFHTSLSYSLQ